MARREARQYKALYFDMRVQALKEFYPKKNHLGAYKEIKNYLLKHEFTHEQWSGYHSVKKITDLEIFELVRDMATEMTWFPDCLHHFEVTNVGTNHDLMKILKPRQLSPKMLNM